MSQAIILIAEDDVNLSEILKTKLTSLGYNVILAHDGDTTEKLIVEQMPDLTMLDIMMPKKSGMEVLESVAKNPATKDLAMMMLSNLGQKKDIDRAQSLGAKDYIVKANISLSGIVDKIDQYLKANPPKERPAQAAAAEPEAVKEKPAPPIPSPTTTAANAPAPLPQIPPPQTPPQANGGAYQQIPLLLPQTPLPQMPVSPYPFYPPPVAYPMLPQQNIPQQPWFGYVYFVPLPYPPLPPSMPLQFPQITQNQPPPKQKPE